MTGRYYFVNFPNLKLRNPDRNTGNLWCDLCRNKNQHSCNCVYYSGNTSLPDKLDSTMNIVGGIGVKQADYYDSLMSMIIKLAQEKELRT